MTSRPLTLLRGTVLLAGIVLAQAYELWATWKGE